MPDLAHHFTPSPAAPLAVVGIECAPERVGTGIVRSCESFGDGALRVVVASRERRGSSARHLEFGWRWNAAITRMATPYFLPRPGDVIADHVFRHGAVLVETERGCAMFAPILPCAPPEIASYVDLDRDGRGLTIRHGVGDVSTRGHVFFARATSARLPAGDISWTHLVAAWPDCSLEDAYERAATLIWATRTSIDVPLETDAAYDRFAHAAMDRIFRDDLYREWDRGPARVAGMTTQTLTAKRSPRVMTRVEFDRFLRHQKRLLGVMAAVQKHMFTRPNGYRLLTSLLHSGRMAVAPIATFGVWFNQVRTALGAALCARSVGDAETERRAGAMVELALLAPLEDGASPSVALLGEPPRWLRGTRAFEMIADAYHLPDMAVTGFHLLEWHEHVCADARIARRCREIAEFLVRVREGATFPSWVRRTATGWIADPFLRASAASAAPALFLARFAKFDADPRWRDAAIDALRHIEREILPTDDWNDFELALSCAGRPAGVDPRTGTRAANTMSIYWAARAALDLADAWPEGLRLARTLAARLCLFQQPHNIPRLRYEAFGGFACMNTDAELSDARQGLFVPLLADLFRATGDDEFRARALAALRACYSLMLIEDNARIAPGNIARFRASDRGAIVENYGHTGRDEPTAGYLSPDWGCGTSLYALGMLRATRALEVRS
ncbi:MAG: hypothetical protein IT350_15970 [Deltaproteobacteria bacterium]|nr:hypothetical protein [Deltaproteobacteria bacterium]